LDEDKQLKDSSLRNLEILVYKRVAVFESVIKNMIR